MVRLKNAIVNLVVGCLFSIGVSLTLLLVYIPDLLLGMASEALAVIVGSIMFVAWAVFWWTYIGSLLRRDIYGLTEGGGRQEVLKNFGAGVVWMAIIFCMGVLNGITEEFGDAMSPLAALVFLVALLMAFVVSIYMATRLGRMVRRDCQEKSGMLLGINTKLIR